jgi:hypothetical protein
VLTYYGLEEASEASIDQSAERKFKSFGSLTDFVNKIQGPFTILFCQFNFTLNLINGNV